MLSLRHSLPCLALAALASALPAQQAVDLLFEEVLPPSNDSSYAPPSSIAFGGFTLFVASTPDQGAELWRTDGTAAGTSLVRDIQPGTEGSDPGGFVQAMGAVYFHARTAADGIELWRTDGTTAGTQMVLDLATGPFHGLYVSGGLLELNGALLFIGRTQQQTFRLYSTDGTPAGTQPIADAGIYFFSEVVPLLESTANGLPGVHVTTSLTQAPTGLEPWITDGTPLGTQLLLDIAPGSTSSTPTEFFGHAGKIYFTADDQVHGRELWVTDGTAAGTQLVHDSAPGSAGLDLDVDGGVSLGGDLWYLSADGRLWRYTDGQGAPVPHSLPVGVVLERTELFSVGNKIVVRTRTAEGRTLHAFDPATIAWSELVKIPTVHPKIGWEGLAVGGQLYFRNYAKTEGFELWSSDGTSAGTGPIASITPGIGGLGPRGMFADGTSGVYFFQAASAVGEELHRATPSAASLIADLAPSGPAASDGPGELTAVRGIELYSAAGPDDAVQHWSPRTGLATLTAGRVEPERFLHTSLGPRGTTFFTGRTAQTGRELWRTTGKAETTRLVLDLEKGPVGASIGPLVELNGALYFQGREQFDYRVYRSDGTGPGTNVLFDAVPNATSKGVAYGLTPWNGKLYFSASGPNLEFDLFVSDGTTAGTQKLNQVMPNVTFGTFNFYDAGTHLAWVTGKTASTIFNDLWVTDGVTAKKLDQFGETVKSVNAIVGTHEGQLYVFADTASGLGFWRVDPVTGATQKLGPFTSGLIYEMWVANGEVYLFKEDFPSELLHIVRIDEATQSEVYLTAPIENNPYIDSIEHASVGDTLYFTARQNGIQEIYLTDGTVAGTRTLASVMPASSVAGTPWTSEPRELTLVGGKLAFIGEDPQGNAKAYTVSNIGSHALDLGPHSGGPTLHASPPKLGQTLTLYGNHAQGMGNVLMYPGEPRALALPLAPGSLAWLDPLSSVSLGRTTSSNWSLSITLPASPALVGSFATVQAFSNAPVPVATNGVMLILGS